MKPGYKKTEIGVIPEDWSAKQIKTFAKICMCKRVFADQTSEAGDVPFYKIGTFGGKPDAYISKSLYAEYKNKYSYPAKGDVLISAAGTLGRTVVFDGKDSYFQDSNIVWLDVDKETICNEYLKHYYEVIQWAASEGSTISRLYNGIIESTYVAIPPLEEQYRIAEALTDMDELIASLGKMIEKKKAIKQGIMQELLTGKRRLPGFTKKWTCCKLSNVLTVCHGQSQQGIEDENGKFPILATGGIIGRTNSIMYADPSVLIGRKGTIDRPQYMDTPFWTIDTLFYTKVRNTCIVKYIFYLFCLIPWNDFNEASGVPSLSASVIEDILVSLPDKEEQLAISSVLSEISDEIEKLEQRLLKLRQLKQGMIQLLLTGEIRLPPLGGKHGS